MRFPYTARPFMEGNSDGLEEDPDDDSSPPTHLAPLGLILKLILYAESLVIRRYEMYLSPSIDHHSYS